MRKEHLAGIGGIAVVLALFGAYMGILGFDLPFSMSVAYADVTVVTGCQADNPFHLYRNYGDGTGVVRYQGAGTSPFVLGSTLDYANDYEVCDRVKYTYSGRA